MVMRIYLNELCAAGVNRFYARQWYNVTNDVTRASFTVEEPLLIKALRIENGWNVDRMTAEFAARQWKQRTFLCTKEHMNNGF